MSVFNSANAYTYELFEISGFTDSMEPPAPLIGELGTRTTFRFRRQLGQDLGSGIGDLPIGVSNMLVPGVMVP